MLKDFVLRKANNLGRGRGFCQHTCCRHNSFIDNMLRNLSASEPHGAARVGTRYKPEDAENPHNGN
jgi:hypothetical protein